MQEDNQVNKIETEGGMSICEGYNIIKYLGNGAYAVVKLGQKGHEQVAIKFQKIKNENDRPKTIQKQQQEVQILEQLKHPRIVELKYFSDNLQYIKKNGQIVYKIGMILELGEKGSMSSFLKLLIRFDEQTSRFYFRQLMTTIIYMKSLNICHLDLKPDNIVFDADFNLKITDFGFSKQAQGLISDFFGGSKPYMAPEIWDKIAYDGSKVDVFAAGQILFKMITGCYAFENCQKQSYNFIKQNDYAQFWNYQNKSFQILFPQGFPEDFKNLINKMLDPDFNRRITPEECLQHPWTMGVEANLYQIQYQFNNEMERVNQQLKQQEEKYKREKQARMEQERANLQMMSLLKNQSYKSGNNQQKNPIIEKKRNLMKKFRFSFENRVLKKSLPTKMIDEILIYDDPENLFCTIIEHFGGYANIKNIHIHKTKYRLNVNIMENDEVKYEIQIELQNLGDDQLRVEVLNLGEDFLKFNEEIQKLKQSISQQQDETQIQQQ